MTHRLEYVLSRAGFVLIMIPALLYTMFSSTFAELHLKVPFLPFPLFVGEIVLALTLSIALLTLCQTSERISRPLLGCLTVLFCFTLIKAAIGYLSWGPLALRNAALFYYALFILPGYLFFDRGVLRSGPVRIGSIIVLSLITLTKTLYTAPSGYIYSVLIAIIFQTFEKRSVRLIGLAWGGALLLYTHPFTHTKVLFIGIALSILYCALTQILLWYRTHAQRSSSPRARVRFAMAAFLSAGAICTLILFDPTLIRRIGMAYDIPRFMAAYHERTNYISTHGASIPESGAVTMTRVYESNDERLRRQARVHTPAEGPPIASFSADASGAVPLARESRIDTNNTFWRLFVWKDMYKEIIRIQPLWGVPFGKPFRSPSIEALRWDYGYQDVGWIEPHNSYLHMFYRGGIVGILYAFAIPAMIVLLTVRFLRARKGLALLATSMLVLWAIVAGFNVFFELPQYAIPFWLSAGALLSGADACIRTGEGR